MNKQDDGGPAFPLPSYNQSTTTTAKIGGVEIQTPVTFEVPAEPGMSLRDWFAGQAITAIIPREGWVLGEKSEPSIREAAEQAYAVADAMLAEREKS